MIRRSLHRRASARAAAAGGGGVRTRGASVRAAPEPARRGRRRRLRARAPRARCAASSAPTASPPTASSARRPGRRSASAGTHPVLKRAHLRAAAAARASPAAVLRAISAANRIAGFPYRYGGGHRSFHDSGYDCSGSVSYVLHGAGLLGPPARLGRAHVVGAAGPRALDHGLRQRRPHLHEDQRPPLRHHRPLGHGLALAARRALEPRATSRATPPDCRPAAFACGAQRSVVDVERRAARARAGTGARSSRCAGGCSRATGGRGSGPARWCRAGRRRRPRASRSGAGRRRSCPARTVRRPARPRRGTSRGRRSARGASGSRPSRCRRAST